MAWREKTRLADDSENSDSEDLEVFCFSSFDAIARLRDEWDDCVRRTGGSVYFCVDWIETWWNFYGSNRALRIFLLRRHGRAIAALPFCVKTVWLGPVRVRIACLVGAQATIPVFSLAIERSEEITAIDSVLDQLFDEDHCDVVSLSPLAGDSTAIEATRALCAQQEVRKNFRLVRDENLAPHTVFKLPDGFDGFLGGLDKRRRSNYRRDRRQLEKQWTLTERTAKDSEAIALFDTFVRLHQEQWFSSGHSGHFGDWPDSLAFNRALVHRLAPKGVVRFYQLLARGEILSIQFCLVFGGTGYWRLPARRTGESLDKLGLGRVGLLMMIEALINEGVTAVEAGPGHYEYKTKHGGEEMLLRSLAVCKAPTYARVKSWILFVWADFLNFAYYRCWFLKVVP